MPDDAGQLDRQNDALTRQLLEWIDVAPRTYAEALERWRSSCPRHTVWEDALEAGLVDAGRDGRLVLTEPGRARLERGGAPP